MLLATTGLLACSVATGYADGPATGENKLVPKTEFDGPFLQFDFDSLAIGVAEYEEGPTGATVFYFPKGAFVAVDVRGGAPGTIETDGLRNGYTERDSPWVDAISFAGGSSYGLEAASGVMAELLSLRNNSTKWTDIASVPGAIIFDFRTRNNAIYPDKELGRAAFKAARPGRFLLGPHGAGRSATVGKYLGPTYMENAGEGGAFRRLGATKLAVFTVVNAVGAIVDRQGQVVRGNRDPVTGKRTHIVEDLTSGAKKKEPSASSTSPQPTPSKPETSNTTITLVVTNQKLSYPELQRLAISTHSAMSRAIEPFHTPNDGDTLFAATSYEVENSGISVVELCVHAADLAWDAVLSSYSTAEAAGK